MEHKKPATNEYIISEREIDWNDEKCSTWVMLPDSLKDAAKKIPKLWFQISEYELEQKLKPDRATCRVRMAFWMEYDRAVLNGNTKLRMPAVYGSIITRELWTHMYKNPEKLAWILCPPADYMVAMNEIMLRGVDLIRDIVTAKNIIDADGNLNAKNASVALQAIETVTTRVRGAPILRTESRSLNVNVNGPPQPPEEKSVEQLKEELGKYRAQLDKNSLLPSQLEPIEFTKIKEAVFVEVEGHGLSGRSDLAGSSEEKLPKV